MAGWENFRPAEGAKRPSRGAESGLTLPILGQRIASMNTRKEASAKKQKKAPKNGEAKLQSPQLLPVAPPLPAAKAAGDEAQAFSEIENYIETYQTNAEWIRFADAKAAVVLAANGALASVLIPTLKPFLQEKLVAGGQGAGILVYGALACFFIWLMTTLFSSIRAFLCIHPIQGGSPEVSITDRCAHFHPAGISARYPLKDIDRFCASFERLGAEGFRREVVSCLLIDAHVSRRKYTNVIKSIQWMGFMALFGFAYLALIQF
jgi:hypothetical protein